MTQPWALLPEDYVSGVRVVETTLRPVRPACLIPDDAPDLAAAFAESRSLAWGGYASYVIPYSRSEGLSAQWEELLGLFDPDRVIALGPLRETDKDRLHSAGRFVYPRDEPTDLSREYSTLLHSVLIALAKDLRPPDSTNFVVVPGNPRGILGYLLMLARYGGLKEEDLKHALESRAPSYEYHLDLSELVRVEQVHPQQHSPHLFAGDLRGWVEEEEIEHALTLGDLTHRGLRITSQARSEKDRGKREVEDEYYIPVVVTGSAYDSVEDFALYWNLRAEHFFARPFPLWLPLDTLQGEDGVADVKRALELTNQGYAVPRNRMHNVRIVSASTGAEELEECLRATYPEAHIGVGSLAELFRTTCYYHHVTEQSTVQFDQGRASVRPPRPDAFKDLVPYIDNVAYDVRVDGMWLPQGKAIARHLGRFPDQAHELISKKGTLRFVKPYSKEFSEADLLDLRTPDGWGLLSSLFEERGYDISPTAKGAAAIGQLQLLGGIENLGVIASSKVRELLRVLSRRRGEKRQYVADRKTLKFEHFTNKWGVDAARDILRWLVERRVLFRGAILKCPKCKLSRWYTVDRVGEVWRCDGCQEDSPIPLELDKTDWEYRINELYAHGHNQGTLTPLLTIYAMYLAWGSSSVWGALSYYPGIELKAKQGANVPFPEKEIDVVVLRGSELMLAECKESTGYLDQPDSGFHSCCAGVR